MTLREIVKTYPWKFFLTTSLVLLDSILGILFPLFIGFAIDYAIDGSYKGAIQLGTLGIISLIIGSGRRFFDSRFYAEVYTNFGLKAVEVVDVKEESKRTARLSMLRELVEFMENSLPVLIDNIIGFIGVIIIISFLNLKIFAGTLLVTLIVFVLYVLSSKRTLRYNEGYNDELEKQVDVITNKDNELKDHLRAMMSWNIKLSDLETLNFSVSWLFLLGFLVLSIIIAISDGITQYGALFALVMYVFQYIGNVINLPLFYQQWLRLSEITERLKRI